MLTQNVELRRFGAAPTIVTTGCYVRDIEDELDAEFGGTAARRELEKGLLSKVLNFVRLPPLSILIARRLIAAMPSTLHVSR
ncbi:uncharacterized protein PHACADRAFT_205794 [Phanerochaete carnosa HHB-10118-sp]|uniref:Uncharacterized protein n=1 Tax=Phanerochaete carnosa (strain HHB-10118-sp) TaxID=650164 RepID=K5V9P9_PHACS|nr:uncharacterized protein PHACADRAFT_205794 [Phanerochaete carnosa HHB-10118-sp]EKM59576.1 hypothetical protein PHACADRAFT_205794 [Phanerochaete carnosa HHB-10118-sp]